MTLQVFKKKFFYFNSMYIFFIKKNCSFIYFYFYLFLLYDKRKINVIY